MLLSSTMVSIVATLLELAFMSTPLVKTTLEILPFAAPLLAPDWLASESLNDTRFCKMEGFRVRRQNED